MGSSSSSAAAASAGEEEGEMGVGAGGLRGVGKESGEEWGGVSRGFDSEGPKKDRRWAGGFVGAIVSRIGEGLGFRWRQDATRR